MPGTYILQMEKVKNLPTLAKKAIHNFRQLPTAAPNADYNMTHLNVTLVNHGIEDYAQLWKERKYEVDMSGGTCNPRIGAVYAYEIILGYSSEAISSDKVMDWAEANINWLGQAFGGRQNVLSVVLHMDEHTPHIHAIVIPIDERNRLCARTFTGGRKIMFELRDTYTEAMKPFGLEAPDRYTKANNKDIKRFYRAVNSIVNTEIPTRAIDEPIESYTERCEEWVRDVEFRALDEVNKANKNVSRLLAKQEEYNLENKDAHHLTNLLIMKYCGNKKRTKKIILQFSNFVDNTPIEVLEKTMDFLEDKFVKNENILGKDISGDLKIIDDDIIKEDVIKNAHR